MRSVIERVIALIFIIIILPLMIVIAFSVYFSLGSPIFFIQKRPGLGGKLFTIFKFRTMVCQSADGLVHKSDEERINKIGWLLRSTSLDELPQLWNIVRGEMSFVGPRPLLKEYLDLYNDRQLQRHRVKPGITGWAQINGRNELPWPEKLEFDVWYVENQSLALDVKIILLTFKKVLARKGIGSKGFATSVPFKGSE